jgi:SAM-dependent methyltransferase
METIFTAHNIRLDDGTYTRPDDIEKMESLPWLVSAKRIINTVFPGDKKNIRIADLGCLEGGYSVEFARMGLEAVGIEVRDSNIAACNYVKSKTNLPNLTFIQDDAWNAVNYGKFDIVFCCGLLYHIDKPKKFLQEISSVTSKLLIVQTHFSTDATRLTSPLPDRLQKAVSKVTGHPHALSRICENEGLLGRWYVEFANDNSFGKRESERWSSWDNRRSFWIQREYLLQAIQDVGFDLVLEQFDSLGSNIAESILRGYYQKESRGTFIGIKTA